LLYEHLSIGRGHKYVSILSDATTDEITVVVATFDRHKTGIINAIETGANNARAERLNGAIQGLKTIDLGYKNIDNFRIAILFFYGDFKTAPH